MIERENEYKHYLVVERPRQLTEGTSNSYIDYLNNVTNYLGINITPSVIRDESSVQNIIIQLSETDMPNGSRRNCMSALRAYLEFIAFYQFIDIVYPDDMPFSEGSTTKAFVNKYERDSKARTACIRHYKPICKVCKLDFGRKYGTIGEGFIHVRHIVPISSMGGQYQIDPIADLVPVCPNCHAMLHKKNPPYTIEEIRKAVRQACA